MSPTGEDRPLTVDEYTEWNARELARHRVSRRFMLKAVAAGAGGYALALFGLANAAFAAGGGTPGPAGVVVSGRHLSFVSDHRALPSNAMAVTAQLVSKTGSLPKGLRAFVDLVTPQVTTVIGSRRTSSTWSASTRFPAARSAASSTRRRRSPAWRRKHVPLPIPALRRNGDR